MGLPIVGVMGSGTRAWEERSAPLGRLLAESDVHLLTGGGDGVMSAVSRAFAETAGRQGLVLGILPADPASPTRSPPGYPNPWVEIPIRTHLPLSGSRGLDPLSRNHLNILSSDAIVCLPGSDGTRSEVELALRYRRPIVAWLERASELPDCPHELPTVISVDEIREFMTAALEGSDPRSIRRSGTLNLP